MVFAVVDKAGTIVMKDGEELDSWSVILNGHVEVTRPDGTIEHLHMGDRWEGVDTFIYPVWGIVLSRILALWMGNVSFWIGKIYV